MVNIHDPASVRAAILEQTGDISILHGNNSIAPELLEGVRDSRVVRK